MQTRPFILLLLALGAAVLPQMALASAAAALQWDSEYHQGFIGHYQHITGTLMTDQGCEPGTTCTPVANASVTIFMAEGGVGELYTQPFPRSPSLKQSSKAQDGKTPKTASKVAEVPSITVTTSDDGSFEVYAYSADTPGTASLNATTTTNGTTIYTPTLTTVQFSLPSYMLSLEPTSTSVEVGSTQTMTATLRLGVPATRKSAHKAGAKGVFEPSPVPHQVITFYREDEFGNLRHSTPNNNRAKVKQATEVGTAVTDGEGKAVIDLASSKTGYTYVSATYTDAHENTWSSSPQQALIFWTPPLPPVPTTIDITTTTTSVTVGHDATMTVTVKDGNSNPLSDVSVAFTFSGPAELVSNNHPEATATKTRRLGPSQSTTVNTDASGEASVTIRSKFPGTSAAVATVYGPSGNIALVSNPILVSWDSSPANFNSITLAPLYQQGPAQAPAHLTATVLDASGAPVQDVNVRFTLQAALSDNTDIDAAAAVAAAASHDTWATTDEQGRAAVTLDSRWPVVVAVTASATNSAGQLVTSNPSLVNWREERSYGPYYPHERYHPRPEPYHPRPEPNHPRPDQAHEPGYSRPEPAYGRPYAEGDGKQPDRGYEGERHRASIEEEEDNHHRRPKEASSSYRSSDKEGHNKPHKKYGGRRTAGDV